MVSSQWMAQQLSLMVLTSLGKNMFIPVTG